MRQLLIIISRICVIIIVIHEFFPPFIFVYINLDYIYIYACIIYKVTKLTIVNCWKKSGLIDNNQSNEELNNNVEKERLKEKETLDELLKLIGREAFFKQFVHPSLKSEIKSLEDFINLEDDCESVLNNKIFGSKTLNFC